MLVKQFGSQAQGAYHLNYADCSQQGVEEKLSQLSLWVHEAHHAGLSTRFSFLNKRVLWVKGRPTLRSVCGSWLVLASFRPWSRLILATNGGAGLAGRHAPRGLARVVLSPLRLAFAPASFALKVFPWYPLFVVALLALLQLIQHDRRFCRCAGVLPVLDRTYSGLRPPRQRLSPHAGLLLVSPRSFAVRKRLRLLLFLGSLCGDVLRGVALSLGASRFRNGGKESLPLQASRGFCCGAFL